MSLLRHGAALAVGLAVALAAVLVHRSAFPLGLLLAGIGLLVVGVAGITRRPGSGT